MRPRNLYHLAHLSFWVRVNFRFAPLRTLVSRQEADDAHQPIALQPSDYARELVKDRIVARSNE